MKPEGITLNLYQRTLPTLEYLLENKNIQVNKDQALNILSNFANNDSCLVLKEKNEENKENVTLDPKSDIKNCLTYVKNQCGKHKTK
jgi:hypothetical protein